MKCLEADLSHSLWEEAQFDVIANIRQSVELETIFQTTIDELRRLLAVDRVGILRLSPSAGWDEGVFVAESVLPRFDAALAQHVVDHCFGKDFSQAYKDGRIQAVDDIYQAGLSPCHIEILEQFQVRANLLVPLRSGSSLWGLLCVHQCSGPRQWQENEIRFIARLADHLGVAIQHAELVAHTQQQATELNQALAELKQLHIQLAHSDKMMGLAQLAAGVAHEINNPINFIYGNLKHVDQGVQELLTVLDLYRQRCANAHPDIQAALDEIDADFLTTDLPKLLNSMRTGACRVSAIVQALRSFAHLDEAEQKPTDLHAGIENTLMLLHSRLQPQPQRPAIALEKDYAELSPIDCYPAQLNQVLMAVLTNAVDALDEKLWSTAGETPCITIRTQRLEDQVVITIEDNGTGIPEAAKTRLFDPFFTTKPVGRGTGLGLAICDRIVALHSGQLTISSQPSQGTQVEIRLPMTYSQSPLAEGGKNIAKTC